MVRIGDLLKSEADTGSREVVASSSGVVAGQLVKYPVTGKYLVALGDEEHGKVLVQPRNCSIFWDNVDKDDVKAKGLTLEKLMQEGVEFGIKFVGSEIDEVWSESSAKPKKPKTDGDTSTGVAGERT